MPRTQLTYAALLSLRDDIIKQQNESPAFYFFNEAKIDRFKSQNSMALKILETRLSEFVKKYVKFDKDMQPMTEMRDGINVYSFYNEEYRQDYLKARNNFLSQKISVDL